MVPAVPEVEEAAVADESPSPETGAPVGPTTAEEASFLAEERGSTQAPVRPARAAEPAAAAELPPLDDLVARIPAPTRALIDELFRAKFVAVKRIPATALKDPDMA